MHLSDGTALCNENGLNYLLNGWFSVSDSIVPSPGDFVSLDGMNMRKYTYFHLCCI